MDIIKCLTVLVLFFFEGGETGGHGKKHHTHVKIHIPEFIHHDKHTKVITIHHHHHKPKKETHHHHHHHKPSIPHHVFHHKTSHSVSKGHTTETKSHHGHHKHHKHHGLHHGHHSHHGHHGHQGHHGHHGHQGHHGHHGHEHHHHDIPTAHDYSPPVSSFEEDFASFSPSDSYSPTVNQIPHVQGIQHTVKQVNVYDSLPGAVPNAHGYQVTEEAEDDDDHFTSVNSIQDVYPATFNYLRGAAAEPTQSHDPFASISPSSTGQHDPFASISPSSTGQHDPFASISASSTGLAPNHDPFAASPEPTSGLGDVETFTGTVSNDFSSLAPTQGILSSAQPELNFRSDFNNPANAFVGVEGGTSSLADEGNAIAPVTYHREAGIQQTVKTGGVETVTY